MTQLRKCKCGSSNYFATVLEGLGKRGSSFSDIDAVSHDKDTRRFLVQEFKREDEPLNQGQHWMLKGLAEIPQHFTVWHVVRLRDGRIGFAVFGQPSIVITVDEYRDRFRAWWASREYIVSRIPPDPPHELEIFELTADDIKW